MNPTPAPYRFHAFEVSYFSAKLRPALRNQAALVLETAVPVVGWIERCNVPCADRQGDWLADDALATRSYTLWMTPAHARRLAHTVPRRSAARRGRARRNRLGPVLDSEPRYRLGKRSFRLALEPL